MDVINTEESMLFMDAAVTERYGSEWEKMIHQTAYIPGSTAQLMRATFIKQSKLPDPSDDENDNRGQQEELYPVVRSDRLPPVIHKQSVSVNKMSIAEIKKQAEAEVKALYESASFEPAVYLKFPSMKDKHRSPRRRGTVRDDMNDKERLFFHNPTKKSKRLAYLPTIDSYIPNYPYDLSISLDSPPLRHRNKSYYKKNSSRHLSSNVSVRTASPDSGIPSDDSLKTLIDEIPQHKKPVLPRVSSETSLKRHLSKGNNVSRSPVSIEASVAENVPDLKRQSVWGIPEEAEEIPFGQSFGSVHPLPERTRQWSATSSAGHARYSASASSCSTNVPFNGWNFLRSKVLHGHFRKEISRMKVKNVFIFVDCCLNYIFADSKTDDMII